MVLMMRPW